tara:strand:+ start:432 stop:728 length:297 start_codon:yes stop_codon:yes gene_type:complete
MITINLNDYDESKTCGDIARELIITGSDPSTIVRFMRGKTKVFLNDSTLNYWSGTAVEESTNGEFMKHVPYRGNFQTHTPTEQPHTVRLTARDDTTHT